MEWIELERICDQVNRLQRRGDFRGLPPLAVDFGATMDPDLLARIVLADIDHVREWERTATLSSSLDDRLHALAATGHQLLSLVES
jgi:hypothetical protein